VQGSAPICGRPVVGNAAIPEISRWLIAVRQPGAPLVVAGARCNPNGEPNGSRSACSCQGFRFLRGTLITEPPAGEHSENLGCWSIPKCRSCPGRLVRSPI
jgi:hypothetical protein